MMSSDSPSLSAIVRSNPRGWLIVAFIFVALSMVFSARSALGLIMPTWEQDLGWARTFISSGGSIVLVFMTLISPLAGNLLDKVGPRPVVSAALLCVGASLAATSMMTEQWQFIVLFCVVGGLGYGALAAPQASAAVAQIFDEHRGLATGIATSGASGGLLIILPLLAALIDVSQEIINEPPTGMDRTSKVRLMPRSPRAPLGSAGELKARASNGFRF